MTSQHRLRIAGALLIALGLAGCRTGVPLQLDPSFPAAPVDFGKFNQTPKPRIGGLPGPGAFTLFELADPARLGHHAYDLQAGEPELVRGILYTCRGGFIDVAHARKSIDLCKFAAVRVEAALLHDLPAFQLKSLEPSLFVVRLQYPPFWKSLSPADKQAFARELSIRMGQRLAMIMITWHEVLTWFGYQSTPFVSERQSSFTYDDTGAHAFGVLVGGRALRSNLEWDRAVTETISSTLRELGVVRPDQAMFAVNRVRGVWWDDSGQARRQIEVGWNGRPLIAWTVPGLPFCPDAQPYRYQLPRLDDVSGQNFEGLFRIEIHPNVFQTDSLRAAIPGRPAIIDVDRDFPALFDHMKRAHIRQSGEQALRPD